MPCALASADHSLLTPASRSRLKEYLGSVSLHLSRPPGTPTVLKWFSLTSDPKFSKDGVAEHVTGRLLLEMQTFALAAFDGNPPPWEQEERGAAQEVPQEALAQVFWWRKGAIHVTIVGAEHLPKMDTFGLCDPLVIASFDEQSHQTRHLRKTLSAAWNESVVFQLADGAQVASRYYAARARDAAAAQRLVTLRFQLLDWDLTGNETIGFVSIELYELMDKIARPGQPGIEASFPVLQALPPSAPRVRGFDGAECELRVRFWWQLDAEAEAARLAAIEAAENEKRRQAREIMLREERRLREQIEEELRVKQALLRERFLHQLVVDADKGGDAYSCGAGAYGQHGQGHTDDIIGKPRLVEGAERGVIRSISAGGAHSFFILEEEEGAGGLLASGNGTWGQLGVIDCKPPPAGSSFDEPSENDAMLIDEQLVPNVVAALASAHGLSLGAEILQPAPPDSSGGDPGEKAPGSPAPVRGDGLDEQADERVSVSLNDDSASRSGELGGNAHVQELGGMIGAKAYEAGWGGDGGGGGGGGGRGGGILAEERIIGVEERARGQENDESDEHKEEVAGSEREGEGSRGEETSLTMEPSRTLERVRVAQIAAGSVGVCVCVVVVCCVCVCVPRITHTHNTNPPTHRHRHTHRQTDRQTDKQTHTHTL